MKDLLLEIKDLNCIYKTDESVIYAVNGLNLSLRRGETLGIVGETGAGKTTTALSIMRLLPKGVGQITEGQILFAEDPESNQLTDLTQVPEKYMQKIRGSQISMIFQDPMTSLNPIMTVGNQIAEVLKIHNTDHLSNEKIEQKVDEILGLVGITAERKNDYPHQFSGGMKQRVVIAIALACNPALLLADEPTTALDVTIQDQVLKMMRELKTKLNTAMILITHDFGVVAETCDSVAVMYAGEIIERGTVEDIFESKDHHPYTVGLFNSIPDLHKKTRRLSPIDGLMPDPSVRQQGCAFYDRCPQRTECCLQKPDSWENNGHMIKCHLFAQSRKEEVSV